MIDRLNAAFGSNFNFFKASVDYIVNEALNDSGSRWSADSNLKENSTNLYGESKEFRVLIGDFNGGGPSVNDIPGCRISFSRENLQMIPGNFVHEFGHIFGLLHTFQCSFFPNNLNDGISDTEIDELSCGGEGSHSNCNSNPANNWMTYPKSVDCNYVNSQFTNRQQEKMWDILHYYFLAEDYVGIQRTGQNNCIPCDYTVPDVKVLRVCEGNGYKLRIIFNASTRFQYIITVGQGNDIGETNPINPDSNSRIVDYTTSRVFVNNLEFYVRIRQVGDVQENLNFQIHLRVTEFQTA